MTGDGFSLFDSDNAMLEWHDVTGAVVMRRHPGAEYRDGEWKPVNMFGLFHGNRLVVDATFEYVTNYYWREFA